MLLIPILHLIAIATLTESSSTALEVFARQKRNELYLKLPETGEHVWLLKQTRFLFASIIKMKFVPDEAKREMIEAFGTFIDKASQSLTLREITQLAIVLDLSRGGIIFTKLRDELFYNVNGSLDLVEFDGIIAYADGKQPLLKRILPSMDRLGGLTGWWSQSLELYDSDELELYADTLELIEAAVERLTLESGMDIRIAYAPLVVLKLYDGKYHRITSKPERIAFLHGMAGLVKYDSSVEALAIRLTGLLNQHPMKSRNIRIELKLLLGQIHWNFRNERNEIFDYIANCLSQKTIPSQLEELIKSMLLYLSSNDDILSQIRSKPIPFVARRDEPAIDSRSRSLLDIRRHELVMFVNSLIDIEQYRNQLIEKIQTSDELELIRIEKFSTFRHFGRVDRSWVNPLTLSEAFIAASRFGIRFLDPSLVTYRRIIASMINASEFHTDAVRERIFNYLQQNPDQAPRVEEALVNYVSERKRFEASPTSSSVEFIMSDLWTCCSIPSWQYEKILTFLVGLSAHEEARRLIRLKFSQARIGEGSDMIASFAFGPIIPDWILELQRDVENIELTLRPSDKMLKVFQLPKRFFLAILLSSEMKRNELIRDSATALINVLSRLVSTSYPNILTEEDLIDIEGRVVHIWQQASLTQNLERFNLLLTSNTPALESIVA
jgi:hypothetical protein